MMPRCKHEWFSAWEDADGNVHVLPSVTVPESEDLRTEREREQDRAWAIGLRWVTRCQMCGVKQNGRHRRAERAE